MVNRDQPSRLDLAIATAKAKRYDPLAQLGGNASARLVSALESWGSTVAHRSAFLAMSKLNRSAAARLGHARKANRRMEICKEDIERFEPGPWQLARNWRLIERVRHAEYAFPAGIIEWSPQEDQENQRLPAPRLRLRPVKSIRPDSALVRDFLLVCHWFSGDWDNYDVPRHIQSLLTYLFAVSRYASLEPSIEMWCYLRHGAKATPETVRKTEGELAHWIKHGNRFVNLRAKESKKPRRIPPLWLCQIDDGVEIEPQCESAQDGFRVLTVADSWGHEEVLRIELADTSLRLEA